MFTGLIEDVGKVVRLQRSGSAASLTVTTALPCGDISLGDSVAVNGACLTVVTKGTGELTFDVSPESLDRTTLGGLVGSAPVNLERALRVGDRLGGHLVSGHIDTVATVSGLREVSGNLLIQFQLSPQHARYIVEKGSVAIDGISLTVNTVSADTFSVNIIPHTAVKTTLQFVRPGFRVNIETDIIGKYVERLLSGQQPPAGRGGLTLESLAANGFV